MCIRDRTLATDVVNAEGKVLVKAGVDLGDVNIKKLLKNGITEVKAVSYTHLDVYKRQRRRLPRTDGRQHAAPSGAADS